MPIGSPHIWSVQIVDAIILRSDLTTLLGDGPSLQRGQNVSQRLKTDTVLNNRKAYETQGDFDSRRPRHILLKLWAVVCGQGSGGFLVRIVLD